MNHGINLQGEYIFGTETPDEDSSGDVSEYNEAIRKMSFVSGKNTLTAEHGSIWQGEGEFDAIEYTVSFSPAGGRRWYFRKPLKYSHSSIFRYDLDFRPT